LRRVFNGSFATESALLRHPARGNACQPWSLDTTRSTGRLVVGPGKGGARFSTNPLQTGPGRDAGPLFGNLRAWDWSATRRRSLDTEGVEGTLARGNGLEIAAWLRDLGLERYTQAFLDAEVTHEALSELNEADLRELGLPLGPRKIVLKAIQAMAGPQTTALPPGAGRGQAGEAAPISGEAERRQLTVMFVDLVGSTVLSSRLDPEEMSELIRSYQNTVAGEITRFEGHVAKFLGDGVLAYFGWPQAHEDDAERAARAAI
jgi:hypothetical protein